MADVLPTDEDREALANLIADFNACGSCADAPPFCAACQGEADTILAWMEREGFRRSVVSTPSDEEREAREFLAKHYTPDVGWTVEELHLTVLIPQSLPMAGNGESLRLVRDILDEAQFDIKVFERQAVSAPPTITDEMVERALNVLVMRPQDEDRRRMRAALRAALGGEA